MMLKLQKLQNIISKAEDLMNKNVYNDINKMLYYQSLFFILIIIKTQIINRYYNNLSIQNFGIKKIRKLLA